MGTTMVALRVNDNRFELGWVGDSRAYLWNGQLRQLSSDHSYVQELIAQGAITSEQARSHPHRNVVTQALGVTDPDSLKVELWLVRSVAGQEDQTVYQTLHATREGAMFAFAPVSIQTPEGAISVQVTGSFATSSGPGGPRLIFVTGRRVSFGPVRGASTDEQGTSRVTKPMPGPDDVLSFELPPIEAANLRRAVPDQFAVRVRIRSGGPVE